MKNTATHRNLEPAYQVLFGLKLRHSELIYRGATWIVLRDQETKPT